MGIGCRESSIWRVLRRGCLRSARSCWEGKGTLARVSMCVALLTGYRATMLTPARAADGHLRVVVRIDAERVRLGMGQPLSRRRPRPMGPSKAQRSAVPSPFPCLFRRDAEEMCGRQGRIIGRCGRDRDRGGGRRTGGTSVDRRRSSRCGTCGGQQATGSGKTEGGECASPLCSVVSCVLMSRCRFGRFTSWVEAAITPSGFADLSSVHTDRPMQLDKEESFVLAET